MADTRFYLKSDPISLEDLAPQLEARLAEPNSDTLLIEDVAPLSSADYGQIAFCGSPKYHDDLRQSKATACIVREGDVDVVPNGMAILVSEDPQKSYALAAAYFYEIRDPIVGAGTKLLIDPSAQIEKGVGIGPGSVIGARAEIGRGTTIGPNVTIGPGVTIGRNSTVNAGAVVQFTLAGNEIVIQPNASIGGEGFGFASGLAGHHKVPQLGRVILQDRVEVGACSAIDRGTVEDTVIGEGTKIDNLVQIGHNCVIGRHCVVVGMVGLSGSTTLGDFVVLGGNAGAAGHLTIGDGAQVAAKAGITKSLPAGGVYGGYPAKPVSQWRREMAALSRLGKQKKRKV